MMSKTLTVLFLFLSLMMSNTQKINYSKTVPNNSHSLHTEIKSTTDYNILFIGNSLTYYNDLPFLVKKEAKKRNIKVETKIVAYPNYAIIDHWNEGKVQKLIKSKKYDYVIIQQGPSSQKDGYDMLVNDGKKYARLCKANNVKLAYFMVWPSITYYHTFNGVVTNYTSGATLNKAILCAVGKKWKEYIDTTNDFSFYGLDGFHPSLKGSKFAAKIIVESLKLK